MTNITTGLTNQIRDMATELDEGETVKPIVMHDAFRQVIEINKETSFVEAATGTVTIVTQG